MHAHGVCMPLANEHVWKLVKDQLFRVETRASRQKYHPLIIMIFGLKFVCYYLFPDLYSGPGSKFCVVDE